MNYASLYNMRSCFTVKRGGDPERSTSTARNKEEREREKGRVVASRWTDRDIVKRRWRRWGGEGGGGINFAIGEFYVRAAAIYYGGAATGFLCLAPVSGFNLYPPTYHPPSTDFRLIQFLPFIVCFTVFNFAFIAGRFIDVAKEINRICNSISGYGETFWKSLREEKGDIEPVCRSNTD